MRFHICGWFLIALISGGLFFSEAGAEDRRTPDSTRQTDSADLVGKDEFLPEPELKSKDIPTPRARPNARDRERPAPIEPEYLLLPYRKPVVDLPDRRDQSGPPLTPQPKFKPAPNRSKGQTPSNKTEPSPRLEIRENARPPQLDEAGFPVVRGAAPLKCPCTQSEARAAQRAWAAALDVPICWLNRIGIEFTLIPPGEYLQGSTAEELIRARQADPTLTTRQLAGEKSAHKVRITRPYYISENEITIKQFRAFVEASSYWTDAETSDDGGEGLAPTPENKPKNEADKTTRPESTVQRKTSFHWRNPGYEQAEDHPVVNVTLRDAEAFCAWLSRQENREHLLPSEVEWEYAARSGERRDYFPEWGCWALSGYVNFDGDREDDGYNFTSSARAHEPNNWGVRNMIGNVWELCYESTWPHTDPDGKSRSTTEYLAPRMLTGKSHAMIRGGSFRQSIGQCRAAFRDTSRSTEERAKPHCDVGFRVIIPIPLPPVMADGNPAVTRPNLAITRLLASEQQDEWAKRLKQPVEFTNSVGIKLRLIPPGEFDMGNPLEHHLCHWEEFIHAEEPDDIPVRKVRITRPFYVGTDAVTQRAYQTVMGRNSSDTLADQSPVTNVAWEDAREFCRRINDLPQERSAGHFYRLPTEAEREYFTRAGTTTRYWYGSDEEFLTAQDKPLSNDEEQSTLEAKRRADWNTQPNPFGLFRLDVGSYRNPCGVREWCIDLYTQNGYSDATFDDPTGPSLDGNGTGIHRVLRGGAESPARDHEDPQHRDKTIGFRVVMVLKQNRTAVVEPLPSAPSAKLKSAQPR